MQRFLQLALDWLDPQAGAPAAAPITASPKTSPKPVAPPVPVVTGTPAESFDRVIKPAHFSHPRATRQSLLGGTRVDYEFRRGRRRTIGFAVGVDGLTVSAPRWVSLHEVEAALQEKAGWIVRKLDEQRERHTRLESQRIDWQGGVSFPFLGEPVVLVLDPRHAFDGTGLLQTEADAAAGAPRLTLHLGLPHSASADQIRDSAQAWLMRQAKRLFTERLDHFAPQLGVEWKKLSLSSASTRWGSASADGAIRLNWRLIHFRLPVIDYVVAHELSHLRVM
ncbi:MAG: M48 family peptidase, partial [Rubrivivax sp.]